MARYKRNHELMNEVFQTAAFGTFFLPSVCRSSTFPVAQHASVKTATNRDLYTIEQAIRQSPLNPALIPPSHSQNSKPRWCVAWILVHPHVHLCLWLTTKILQSKLQNEIEQLKQKSDERRARAEQNRSTAMNIDSIGDGIAI